jgi:hypothetical protein
MSPNREREQLHGQVIQILRKGEFNPSELAADLNSLQPGSDGRMT